MGHAAIAPLHLVIAYESSITHCPMLADPDDRAIERPMAFRPGSHGKHMFDETYAFTIFPNIYFVEFWVKKKHVFLASEDF